MALILSENPMMDTIQAVTVVPMAAPMLTPIACLRVRRPAFTKDTTMTVVAEEDWIIAVMPNPVRIALNLRPVIKASTFCIRWPAACWRPSLNTFIPYRKRPRLPANAKVVSRYDINMLSSRRFLPY
jgi:hypothetical protein